MDGKKLYLQLIALLTGPSLNACRLNFEFRILKGKKLHEFLDDRNNKHPLFHQHVPDTPCCLCIGPCSIAAKGKKGCLNRNQFVLLFDDTNPPAPNHELKRGQTVQQYCICKISAKQTTKVSSLDITLMNIINHHCKSSVALNKYWLQDMKEIRNFLFHSSPDTMNKSTFDIIWKKLESVTLGFAAEMGEMHEIIIKDAIETRKNNISMDELEEIAKEFKNTAEKILVATKDAKDAQSHIDNNLQSNRNGLCQISEYIKEQKKQNTDMLSLLGQLNERMGRLEQSIELNELVRSNVSQRPIGEKELVNQPISMEAKVTGSFPNENEAIKRLSTTTADDDQDEFKLNYAGKGCILLQMTSNKEIFINEESLRSAIRSLATRIVEAGEIDTSVESSMTIVLTFTSPITKEERNIVCLMLSKYGILNEAKYASSYKEGENEVEFVIYSRIGTVAEDSDPTEEQTKVLQAIVDEPPTIMKEEKDLSLKLIDTDHDDFSKVESNIKENEHLKIPIEEEKKKLHRMTDKQDVLHISLHNITCELILKRMSFNLEQRLEAEKIDTDVHIVQWMMHCPSTWKLSSIVEILNENSYLMESSELVSTSSDEKEHLLTIRTKTQRTVFSSLSTIEFVVQTFVNKIITKCNLQIVSPENVLMSIAMLSREDAIEVRDENSSDAIEIQNKFTALDDYTVECIHCLKQFECYKCIEKGEEITQLYEEITLEREKEQIEHQTRGLSRHESLTSLKKPLVNVFTLIKVCMRACMTYYLAVITMLLLGLSILLAYHWIEQHHQKEVVTPLNVPKVNAENSTKLHVNPKMYWGTYRANLYFGMKTRSPKSPVVGLMWFEEIPGGKNRSKPNIRHWCKPNDGLRYGWKKHDGKSFGIQEIVDDKFSLTTSFLKHSSKNGADDWSWRISVLPKEEKRSTIVSLFVYFALEDDEKLYHYTENERITCIGGGSEELGNFSITFPPVKKTKHVKYSRLVTKHEGFTQLEDVLLHYMTSAYWNNTHYFTALQQPMPRKKTNLFVHQVTGEIPLEIDVVYETGDYNHNSYSMKGQILTEGLKEASIEFDERFASTFDLESKGFSLKEIDFAKAGISNLLGEISYFYGSSRVKSKYSTKPLDYWPAALYTSIPSRSNFPRGFLWNVGFDNLLISLWDPKITEDIIGHWLDLLNKEGWIPREQILGEEAKARCPDEFIVQDNKNANPPTLFLTIQYLMRRGIVDKTFLEKIFPRLKVMFDWYNTSQAGLLPSTYYWRGRHYNVIHQINPLTPSSGFDDYPRASHPSSKELHLDLRCWMALASRAMSDIGKKIKKEWQIYEDTHQLLVDNDLLDKYHWSSLKSMYSDIGLHVPLKYRGHKPKLLYINSFGYASLFPIMLKIIDPESGRLTQMLSDMKKHELLWTDYGLRSLAKNSSFYQLPNTVTDPPYWRGSIWINMNYLTLSGLYYYRTTPGKNQKLATDVYNELRRNIISNVYKEYSKRGFLFEQYDDKTGAGKGAHPFSGWSALIVAIMAEEY